MMLEVTARTIKRTSYPAYKDSGVEWLGDVPAHWEVKRLKHVASHWVSNVDKVATDDELPVRLCNYTDVYYHDYIRPDMGLMETTATAQEINRFGLQVDDVVITKDSEDWCDIGVPALVVESTSDLVCGYHLAIIRPKNRHFSALLIAYPSELRRKSAVSNRRNRGNALRTTKISYRRGLASYSASTGTTNYRRLPRP